MSPYPALIHGNIFSLTAILYAIFYWYPWETCLPFAEQKKRSIFGEWKDRGVKGEVFGEEEGGEITNEILKINK